MLMVQLFLHIMMGQKTLEHILLITLEMVAELVRKVHHLGVLQAFILHHRHIISNYILVVVYQQNILSYN